MALIRLTDGQYLLPGLSCHIHAPSGQAGIALDAPLDVWLNEHTFPVEAKYKDIDFAKSIHRLSGDLTARGTTSPLFRTIHKESSFELVKIAAEKVSISW